MTVSTISATGLAGSVSQLGKNLINNGAMTVDQRAAETRTGLGAAAAYHFDQWKYTPSGSPSGRFTLSSGTGLAALGYANSLKVAVTTADDALAAPAYYGFTTYVEAQNLQHLKYGLASAEAVTLSFAVITDTAAEFTAMIIAPDGSRSYSTGYTVSSADTAQEFSLTFPGDASGTITDNAGRGFEVVFTLAAGSNFRGGTEDAWGAEANNKYGAGMTSNMFDTNGNYWEISGVQLEVGSVATDFEHEAISQTEQKCDRYYQRYTYETAYSPVGDGHNLSTTQGRATFYFRQKMRGTPVGSVSNAADFQAQDTGGTYDTTVIILTEENANTMLVLFTVASSLNDGDGVRLRTDGTVNRYIEASAEL